MFLCGLSTKGLKQNVPDMIHLRRQGKRFVPAINFEQT